jgi:chaperonin GroES
MKAPFKPLYDKLLVKKDEKKSEVAGFIVPESAKEKPESGIILAVGHGRLLADGQVIPLQVKPNDHILFGKWSGTEIKIKNVEYLLMDESEVFGFLLPEEEEEKTVE